MEIWLKGFQCQRCGHQWRPRKEGIPKKCPNCDSSSWQTSKEGMQPLPQNGAQRIPVKPTPVRGTPAKEFARRLKGLEWPDEDFADDLEAIQQSQPMAELTAWPS